MIQNRKPSGKDSSEWRKQIRSASMAVIIPMILLASPIVGYVLGCLIDSLLHTRVFCFIFLVLGFVAGVRETYEIIKKISH